MRLENKNGVTKEKEKHNKLSITLSMTGDKQIANIILIHNMLAKGTFIQNGRQKKKQNLDEILGV